MSPAAKLATEREPEWFPIDGFLIVCDVCGEAEPVMYWEQPSLAIVCKKHRRDQCNG